MENYHALLYRILEAGKSVIDRTQVGTIRLFGEKLVFDISNSIPVVTTKEVKLHSVIHELLWMISGQTNIKYLVENGVNMWNNWANDKGDLGPVYGKQWRRWGAAAGVEIDQLQECIQGIKNNPYSRRHIISAWNVGEIEAMALPPCPVMMQFFVEDGMLSCQVYQRSADCFLGLPFDIAGYSILTYLIAQVTGLKPSTIHYVIGDAHIYLNHVEQVKLQLTREHKQLPTLYLNPTIQNIEDFKYSDIQVLDYKYHPFIKASIAV